MVLRQKIRQICAYKEGVESVDSCCFLLILPLNPQRKAPENPLATRTSSTFPKTHSPYSKIIMSSPSPARGPRLHPARVLLQPGKEITEPQVRKLAVAIRRYMEKDESDDLDSSTYYEKEDKFAIESLDNGKKSSVWLVTDQRDTAKNRPFEFIIRVSKPPDGDFKGTAAQAQMGLSYQQDQVHSHVANLIVARQAIGNGFRGRNVIPKVYHWDAQRENEVGAPYIAMSFLGEGPRVRNTSPSGEEPKFEKLEVINGSVFYMDKNCKENLKTHINQQLAQFLACLQEKRFDKMGVLFVNHGRRERYSILEDYGRPKAVVNKEKTSLDWHAQVMNSFKPLKGEKRTDKQLGAVGLTRAILSLFVPPNKEHWEQCARPFSLYWSGHEERNLNNIIVDKDGNIHAVLGWQKACVLPAFLTTGGFPSWLTSGTPDFVFGLPGEDKFVNREATDADAQQWKRLQVYSLAMKQALKGLEEPANEGHDNINRLHLWAWAWRMARHDDSRENMCDALIRHILGLETNDINALLQRLGAAWKSNGMKDDGEGIVDFLALPSGATSQKNWDTLLDGIKKLFGRSEDYEVQPFQKFAKVKVVESFPDREYDSGSGDQEYVSDKGGTQYLSSADSHDLSLSEDNSDVCVSDNGGED